MDFHYNKFWVDKTDIIVKLSFWNEGKTAGDTNDAKRSSFQRNREEFLVKMGTFIE